MAWSTVTLATLNSIAKYEAEINNLAGSYIRYTLAIDAGGTVKLAGGTISSASLTATYIDDTQETLVYNAGLGGWFITTGGLATMVAQGDDIVIPTIQGSGNPYDTSGIFYISVSTSSGVGWDDSTVQSTWQNKCNLSKQQIGDEIKKQIAITIGWRDTDVTSGEVLDYIWNTDALNTAADCLTLHLIYSDLYATLQSEAYKMKMDYYWNRYQTALMSGMYQLLFGESSTTTTPLFSAFGTRLVL